MKVFISADAGKDGTGKFSASCLHPQAAQVQIYG